MCAISRLLATDGGVLFWDPPRSPGVDEHNDLTLMTPREERAAELRLEADLLAAGLRTKYCTEGDCIARVTGRGAVTLCHEHLMRSQIVAMANRGQESYEYERFIHAGMRTLATNMGIPPRLTGRGNRKVVVYGQQSKPSDYLYRPPYSSGDALFMAQHPSRETGAPHYASGQVPMVGDVVALPDGRTMTVTELDIDGEPAMAGGRVWRAHTCTLVRCGMGKHGNSHSTLACKRCGHSWEDQKSDYAEGVTLACGGVAHSGDRVVVVQPPPWWWSEHNPPKIGDVHTMALRSPGRITIFINGARHAVPVECFALLRDPSEEPVIGTPVRWRIAGRPWQSSTRCHGQPDYWNGQSVEWFYLENPF